MFYAIAFLIIFVRWTQSSLFNTSCILTDKRLPTNCTSQAEFVNLLRSQGYIKTNSVAELMTNFDRKYYVPFNPYLDVCDLILNNTNVYDSPPRMHAFALEILKEQLKKNNRVLEVGYGSGYLTVCMSRLVGPDGFVVAIDNMPGVYDVILKALDKDPYYKKKTKSMWMGFHARDVFKGDPDHAPFNAIYISLAGYTVPENLIAQLAKGGRLVMPIGDIGAINEVHIYDKDLKGNITISKMKGNFCAGRSIEFEEMITESEEYIYRDSV